MLDLVGKKFGRLFVIAKANPPEDANPDKRGTWWLCKCDPELGGCGKEKVIYSRGLMAGSTKSCGCIRQDRYRLMNQAKIIDLTGQRFGTLVVLKRGDNYVDKNGHKKLRWLCKCEKCGKEKNVVSNSLRKIKGLGCSSCTQKENVKTRFGGRKLIDLTGMTFGNLLVIERVDNYISPKGQPSSRWKCKCTCGNIVAHTAGDLRRKDGHAIRSCGCTGFESSVAMELKKYCVETYSAIPEYPEFKNPETGYVLPLMSSS